MSGADHWARGLAERIRRAHGDIDIWSATLRLRLEATGLAFASKGQPHVLSDLAATIQPWQQRISIEGSRPTRWRADVADSADLRRRVAGLRTGRARFTWTPEEAGVFAAVALWTYLCLPHALTLPETALRRLLPEVGGLAQLAVRLPPRFVSHCPEQVVHVDERGLIRRHDYTALAFGRWARASQLVGNYRRFDGLAVATTRRVHPRVRGRPLSGVTLVRIRVHELRVDADAGGHARWCG